MSRLKEFVTLYLQNLNQLPEVLEDAYQREVRRKAAKPHSFLGAWIADLEDLGKAYAITRQMRREKIKAAVSPQKQEKNSSH